MAVAPADGAPQPGLGSERVIRVVVLEGDGESVRRAERRLRRACEGYHKLREGVWLANADLRSKELRDLLGDGLDDFESARDEAGARVGHHGIQFRGRVAEGIIR